MYGIYSGTLKIDRSIPKPFIVFAWRSGVPNVHAIYVCVFSFLPCAIIRGDSFDLRDKARQLPKFTLGISVRLYCIKLNWHHNTPCETFEIYVSGAWATDLNGYHCQSSLDCPQVGCPHVK